MTLFKNIMFIEKATQKERIYYLNKIDVGLNIQRALLRIMKKKQMDRYEKV